MKKSFSSNQVFFESGMEIRFNEDVDVIKFDDHRFYKYLSGRGLKGVDFMILDPVLGLFLIEIKNFVDVEHQPNKEAIAKEFYQKCEDSLRLIEIVNKYYQRQWWFKLIRTFKLNNLLNKEVKNWILAYEFCKSNKVKIIGDFGLELMAIIN